MHFCHHFSQEELLAPWGGVVPEIAARNHLEKLAPLLEKAFEQSPISPGQLDAIAVTTHPGLLGPLLTGLNAAKTLALIHQIPLISVNHLYAHLEAIHLQHSVDYPYLGLLVSGGHSLFFRVDSARDFCILGSTIDDAAGEALDKGGRLLGLPYPSGKYIDKLSRGGNENQYPFPIGLKESKDCRLSFSGVKTFLRQFLEQHPQFRQDILAHKHTQEVRDLLASYQWAIVSALGLKLAQALKLHPGLPIVVGGGVACNSRLRTHLQEQFGTHPLHFVAPEYCTDNGAMIAHMGLRTFDQCTPFPQCLELDAWGRFSSGARE